MTTQELFNICRYNNFIFPNQEIILISYDAKEIKPKELADIGNSIKSQFPKQKVIALPDTTSITSVPKQTIQAIIKYLSDLIEEGEEK